MSFASNLKNAMDARKMNQTELSGLTGFSKAAISQYLSGKNVPGPAKMERLAEVLEVSVGYLEGQYDCPDVDSAGKAMKNVPVELAAKLLGKSQQFVRVSLQRGAAPFGFAVRVSGEKWSYHISPRKLNEYLGKAS